MPGVSNAGEVGAPTHESETVQPGETTESRNGLADLSTLPDLNVPAETGSTNDTSGPGELAAPGSVLPESLSTTNALDIVAPSVTGAAPPTGDPNEVTPPSTPTAPDVGTAPSGGPLEVVPPAGIGTPNVPPIGAGTPDPVGDVTPPIGWKPENDDQAITPFDPCGDCNRRPSTLAGNVDQEADNNENAQEASHGGDGQGPGEPGEAQEDDEEDLRNEIADSLPDIDEDKLEEFIDLTLAYYEANNGDLSPADRVAVLKEIGKQAAEGMITEELIGDVTATLRPAMELGDTNPTLILGSAAAMTRPVGSPWVMPDIPWGQVGKAIGRIGTGLTVACIFVCTYAGDHPEAGRFVRAGDFLNSILMTKKKEDSEHPNYDDYLDPPDESQVDEPDIEFDWDDANIEHILGGHGVNPEDVEDAILDPNAIPDQARNENGEKRDAIIGQTYGGQIIRVVYTARDGKIRPITVNTDLSKAQVRRYRNR